MPPTTATPPIDTRVPMLARCVDLPHALATADSATIEGAIQSLSAQLTQLGWQLASSAPGARSFTKDGRILALDQIIPMVAGGYITPENWSATCAADGISELEVPVYVAAPVATPEPVVALPYAASSTAGGNPDFFAPSQLATWGRVFVVILAIAVTLYLRLGGGIGTSDVNDHLANHRGIEGETEVAAEGRFEVNHGRATTTYVKQDHEFEVYSFADSNLETPDLKSVEVSSIDRWSQNGRSYVELKGVHPVKPLRGREAISNWLKIRNASEAQDAQRFVKPSRTTVAGRDAWVWEYMTPQGWWIKTTRIPDGSVSYNISCRLMPELDNPAARARCDQVRSNLRIQ